jgi:V8-like Glu-specific endopeptidase
MSAPIIGGTVDTGDPAVVLLASYDHSTVFTCTAVVIAPQTLLTAAHCLDHPGYQYGVFFGADASSYSTLAQLEPELGAVTAVHMHPQYSRAAPFFADIGVVMLAEPTSVPPLSIQRTPPGSEMAGAQVRIVGYGQTSYGQPNWTKYTASTTVMALQTDDTILIGDTQRHTCLGDSGGPALLGDVVIGIDSYASSGCTEAAFFRRTDAFLSFIDDPANDPPPEQSGCAVSNPGAATALVVGLLCYRRRWSFALASAQRRMIGSSPQRVAYSSASGTAERPSKNSARASSRASCALQ